MAVWSAKSGSHSTCWICLLVALGLAVVFSQFSYWFMLDLAVGFAGSICKFLQDPGPCSCWIWIPGVFDFVGLLFDWVLVKLMAVP